MRVLIFLISFASAFLLFAVQPMATKWVLPALGGTPAVWNTAMFSFQLLLLAGYLYAHWLAKHIPARLQWMLHGSIMLASCSLLPLLIVIPSDEQLVMHPIFYLMRAFLTQVGPPFFCVAATAPLLQSWVSRSSHPLAQKPYVLYSASNFGSFAGLLGYVGMVEPLLDLSQQRMGWSGLYVATEFLLLYTGWRLCSGARLPARAAQHGVPGWRTRLVWIWLAFLPSSLSLGVTTYIATDVASIPLLWVIPLSIYLLSFVDAFRSRPAWVPFCQRVVPIFALLGVVFYGIGSKSAGIYLMHVLVFAVCAFAIHGWLASRRPPAAYLTQFYVCLSLGGALGGLVNGLAAPLVLTEAFEYPIVLLLAAVTAFILLQQRADARVSMPRHVRLLLETAATIAVLTPGIYAIWLWCDSAMSRDALNGGVAMGSASIAGLVSLVIYRSYVRAYYACIATLVLMLAVFSHGLVGLRTLYKDRNFFGVSRVYENAERNGENARYYIHNTTLHGLQSLDPQRALQPVSYYMPLKKIVEELPAISNQSMGVIGLGIGTVQCYAKKGQQVDYFEINPIVRMLAEDAHYFTYLRDCPGSYTIFMGDGRIRLAEQPAGRYGLLVLDAFASDAIPSHLLTREAFAIYLSKLAPHGVMAINVSNRHIDLRRQLGAQADALGLVAFSKFFEPSTPLAFASGWIILARDVKDVAVVVNGAEPWTSLNHSDARLWTDHYINLLPYLKLRR